MGSNRTSYFWFGPILKDVIFCDEIAKDTAKKVNKKSEWLHHDNYKCRTIGSLSVHSPERLCAQFGPRDC